LPTLPRADARRRALDSRVASYLEAASRSLSEGKLEEALGYERLALQRAQQLSPAPSPEQAAVDWAAAKRLELEGEAGGAAERYRAAFSVHRELGLASRETYDLAYAAATAAREAGETEQAVQLFGEAIELAATQFGDAALPSVPARVGLAYSLVRLGRLAEALQALEHALSVCQKHGPAGSRSAALVHEAIAAVRGESGEGDAAAGERARAAEDMERVEERLGKQELTAKQTRLAEELEVIEGPEDTEDPDQVLADLEANLIGLDEVKAQFRRLVNLLLVQARRREHGHRTSDRRLHLVMVGPPGTGKTTVASYLGRICRSLGLLASADVVVVSRGQIVRGHVGQTAIRTNDVVDFALDKVLFIDEAYSLAPAGADNDFGPEAIAELMIRMERDADRLVAAVAGYPEEMKRFLESNSGFGSRFTDTLTFDHYSAEELQLIFEGFCEANEYRLSGEAGMALRDWCERSAAERERTFGNGRAMRNLFDDVIGAQADRIVSAAKLDDPEALLWIEAADFPAKPQAGGP
jgi:tetratricopeptide (TPR) repeat protein